MVEAIFDLFEVHGEVIFGDSSITVQDVLCVAPEALDAIDVVARAPGDQGALMVHDMMLAIATQRLVSLESVREVDRALARVCSDVAHELFGADVFDDFGVDASITLQKAENHAFPCGASTSPAFTPATKVSLIELDLSFQSTGFQLGQMKERFAQSLIDARDNFDVDLKILSKPIGGLQLIEPGEDGQLTLEASEALNPTAQTTLHVTASGAIDFEGAAEDTLPAPQIVGRTAEMTRFASNHRYPRAYLGYKTP